MMRALEFGARLYVAAAVVLVVVIVGSVFVPLLVLEGLRLFAKKYA